jgi:very-short-patch-repair endonuclease
MRIAERLKRELETKQKTESPIEDILLRELHLAELYPVCQFVVGEYRLDMAFPENKIAIECDGKEWHSSQEQIERDRNRDKYLEDLGWKIIRITGSDIYKKADEIVNLMLTGKERKRIIKPTIKSIDYFQENLDEIEFKKEDNAVKVEEYYRERDELINGSDGMKNISDIIKKRYKNFV